MNNNNYRYALNRFQNSLQELSDVIYKGFEPSISAMKESYSDIARDTLSRIAEEIQTSFNQSFYNSRNMQLIIDEIAACQQKCINEMLEAFQLNKTQSIFEGISVHEDFIEISDESYNTLSSVIEYPREGEQPVKKFSFRDFFIAILFPILLQLLSLIQNSYYHHIDALEAQKQQLETEKYNQQIIQITSDYNAQMEQLNNSIQAIVEYLEANDSKENLPICSSVATDSNAVLELHESALEIDDESDNPDTHQQPD